jgi:glucokinase
MAVLAVDIGGTKIACGVVGDDGSVSARTEAPTDAGQGAQGVIRDAVALAERTAGDYGGPLAAAGVATGGDVDARAGVIRYATPMISGYAGTDARAAFARSLGLPVWVDNDGNCAALAEVVHGSARGFTHALTVVVGTGIGAGYVVNGALLRGAQGGALNPGQMRLAVGLTYEDVASSGAIATRHGAPIRELGARLATAAQLPDDVAAAGRALGELLAACAAILDPDVIVVGGSVLLLGERHLDLARAGYRRNARPPQRDIPVRASSLGRDAALIGAALICRGFGGAQRSDS